jgi:alginate O-acetyltransferase complex protein AlgI
MMLFAVAEGRAAAIHTRQLRSADWNIMIFASLSFIFLLLPLFLLFDFATRRLCGVAARNAILLGVSLLFYIWGEAANVFVLLGMGLVNYYGALRLPSARHPRLLLCLLASLNLGTLIGFKYAVWLLSFLLPNLADAQPHMPLGISFFTFHAISYVVDVYRRHIAPARSALDFMTYFCMFPHLVAGPIVRYAQVREDMAGRGPGRELFTFGLYRFLLGLNKKVIIANTVSVLADSAFSLSARGHLEFFDAWIGICAYAVQIYYDFSGYSDMAIGLAAMAGFHFDENFRRPYSSRSIREFWRRWHISLSTWLRDYLYIPLGGSRAGNLTTYRNLLLVFLLCGLWHGADVTFILWGLWHGLFLALERLGLGKVLDRLPGALGQGYTLLAAFVGWVFFRAENLGAATAYLGDMMTPSLSPAVLTYYALPLAALGLGLAFSLAPDRFFPAPTSRAAGAFPASAYCLQALLAVVSVSLLLTSARNPFIYFNF